MLNISKTDTLVLVSSLREKVKFLVCVDMLGQI